MLDIQSVLSEEPVPPVDAGDLARVWEMMAELRSKNQGVQVGWDIGVIADQCAPGTDMRALCGRLMLLSGLLEPAMLDQFFQGENPRDRIIEMMAIVPIPEGIQRFDFEGFAELVRKTG